MKKLLILGGPRYCVPVIDTAHKLGIYVITCDSKPDNIAHESMAHQYSDEYVKVDITDKDKTLEVARRHNVDGVMSFAFNMGVVTAAYIAEEMNLPFQCSYKSAEILQDKGLFRQFLSENHFNVPKAKKYTDINEPMKDIDWFKWPVIVKPADSSGSKGVKRADTVEELKNAIPLAIEYSNNGTFIVEEFLVFEGYHSGSDPVTVDGKLKFVTYSDQSFDSEADNPYIPVMLIWPSSMKQRHQDELSREIQRLMDLLDMKTGIYNIETCVSDGKPYIMEVSPRGGGCKTAEMQEFAFRQKFIENEVRMAVGLPLHEVTQTECQGFWCVYVVHAKLGQRGVFECLKIASEIKEKYVKIIDLSVKKGDFVQPFTGSNMALGDICLGFDSREELDKVMADVDKWLTIELS